MRISQTKLIYNHNIWCQPLNFVTGIAVTVGVSMYVLSISRLSEVEMVNLAGIMLLILLIIHNQYFVWAF